MTGSRQTIGSARHGPHGAIGAFLRAPVQELDLNGFCAQFEARRIKVRLAGCAAALVEPALIGRLRGALGEVLRLTASPEAAAGEPCPWSPPSAYEALFRKQGRMTPGTDFPSPWALAVMARRGDLDILLTLFGIAGEWAPAAAEALVEVVQRRIDWRTAAQSFVPAATIVNRQVATVPVATGPAPSSFMLDFLTPLVISSGDAGENPVPAFTSFGYRLEGLARWHGATLAPVDWRALAQDLRQAEWTWSDSEAVRWDRGSRRQDRWIAMSGTLGRLHIGAAPEAMHRLAPLMRLGEVAHIGADVAFGCGRYALTTDRQGESQTRQD